MAFKLVDMTKETSTTTGTGTITLAGAATGFLSFSGVGDANTTAFTIQAINDDGQPSGDFETSFGTYTSSGTTLSRDRIYASSNSGAAVNFGAGTKVVYGARPAILGSVLHYQDRKATLTDGGTATSGSWFTRDITNEVTDDYGQGTLSSNQITLAAGIWFIDAFIPGFRCASHKTRLYNTTGTTTVVLGSTATSAQADNCETRSVLRGEFTIAASQALEIQQQVSTTQASDGLGNGVGFSVEEYYTDVKFTRIA